MNLFNVIKSILQSPNKHDLQLIKDIPQKILDAGKEADLYKWIADFKDKHKVYPTYLIAETEFPELTLVRNNTSTPSSYILDKFLSERKKTYIKNIIDEATEKWDTTGIPPDFQYLFKETQEVVAYGVSHTLTNTNTSLEKLLPTRGTFKTGMKGFDDAIGGLSGGEVVAFCARPNIGKTSFLSWLSGYIWYNQNNRVLFVSCEQSSQNIMQRFVALNGDFNPNVFRNYDDPTKVSQMEKNIVESTILRINAETDKTFIVPENLVTSVGQIAELISVYKPDIVIVDAFYKLDSGLKESDDTANVQKIIRSITQLAINYDIPIVLSTQLTKTAKEGTTDLRDIGFTVAISQECAFVFFIDRDKDVTKRTVSMTKTRAGSDGLIMQYEFDTNNLKFTELED